MKGLHLIWGDWLAVVKHPFSSSYERSTFDMRWLIGCYWTTFVLVLWNIFEMRWLIGCCWTPFVLVLWKVYIWCEVTDCLLLNTLCTGVMKDLCLIRGDWSAVLETLWTSVMKDLYLIRVDWSAVLETLCTGIMKDLCLIQGDWSAVVEHPLYISTFDKRQLISCYRILGTFHRAHDWM